MLERSPVCTRQKSGQESAAMHWSPPHGISENASGGSKSDSCVCGHERESVGGMRGSTRSGDKVLRIGHGQHLDLLDRQRLCQEQNIAGEEETGTCSHLRAQKVAACSKASIRGTDFLHYG